MVLAWSPPAVINGIKNVTPSFIIFHVFDPSGPCPDRIIQCDGAVVNVEIRTSTIKDGPSYIERATLCTADIGADDIILGDPSLKSHEGGP